MTHSMAMPGAGDSQEPTCLEWSSNGELTAFDLHRVLERLARVEPRASALHTRCAEALRRSAEPPEPTEAAPARSAPAAD